MWIPTFVGMTVAGGRRIDVYVDWYK